MNIKNGLFLCMLFFAILYCFLYILRDIYFSIENFQMKKYINKILPFFTKYNVFFLVFTFIILVFTYYNMYISKLFFFIILVSIVLSFTFIYIPIKKFKYTNSLRLLSYMLLIEVILICIV